MCTIEAAATATAANNGLTDNKHIFTRCICTTRLYVLCVDGDFCAV